MHALPCWLSRRQPAGRSSLDRLDAGRLEAGELELHAALELVEQLLQQPVGEPDACWFKSQSDSLSPTESNRMRNISTIISIIQQQQHIVFPKNIVDLH